MKSLHPSDDERDLEILTGTATGTKDPPDKHELAEMLEKNDATGPPATKQLAEITDKRLGKYLAKVFIWRKYLAPEKIKLLTERYLTPENCVKLLPVRANPEIYRIS